MRKVLLLAIAGISVAGLFWLLKGSASARVNSMDVIDHLRRRAPDDSARFDFIAAWVNDGDRSALDRVVRSDGPKYRTTGVDALVELLPFDRAFSDPERRAAQLFVLAASESEFIDWTSDDIGTIETLDRVVSPLPVDLRTLALQRIAILARLVVDGSPTPAGTLLTQREDILRGALIRSAEEHSLFGLRNIPALLTANGTAENTWLDVHAELSPEARGALAFAFARAGNRWAIPTAVELLQNEADTWRRLLSLEELEGLYPGCTGEAYERAARDSLAGSPSANNHDVSARALARAAGVRAVPAIVEYIESRRGYSTSWVARESLEVLGDSGLPILAAAAAEDTSVVLAGAVEGLLRAGLSPDSDALKKHVVKLLDDGDDRVREDLLRALDPKTIGSLRQHVERLAAADALGVRDAARDVLADGRTTDSSPTSLLESLGEPAERLEDALLPNVSFVLETPPNDRVGASRFGGDPDVPEGFVWPLNRGRPLDFLFQVELSAIAKMNGADVLPQTGILAFFYDLYRQPWGYDPDDLAGFRVYHFPDAEKLVRRSSMKRSTRLEPRSVTFFPAWSMPTDDTPPYPELREEIEADEWWERYEQINARLRNPRPGPVRTKHQLLGHADIIQNPMQIEAELVTNGLYCGDGSGYSDPRAAALAEGAKDWILLLQLDSDDDANVMWGDSGRLYFWIRRQDLADRRFDRVWMTLQCS